ncbi:hypothetical protein SSX86_000812 [Deinandra increscens subsp. villosa]|uniref:Phytosulfokine n=1 Tax=Deinandra increscens subsp. villosa TaxID=3103831 RepID=A0AAP0DUX2_9ASTR
MKHTFRCGVPFIFLLLSLIAFSHYASALRFLHIKPKVSGEKTMNLDEDSIISGESISPVDPETVDWFNLQEVMGLEECESGDEDCLKRRVLADAHLDYIYTQHHKP